jgi:hypothetical protein
VPEGLGRGHAVERREAHPGTGRPDAVRMSEATADIRSPTRHCQIAECSESIDGATRGGSRRGRRAGTRRRRRRARAPGA